MADPSPADSSVSLRANLLAEFESAARAASAADALMKQIAQRLHQAVSRYNWVGFYLPDKTNPGYLVVGPYVGSFSPNERIPLGRGLCGAAASSGKTIVVQNVADDPRYLPGTDMVKSEMVIPFFAKGSLAGLLDVESYFAATFGPSDQLFLEAIASLLGRFIESPKS